jgi:SHS2 domain-containing protein
LRVFKVILTGESVYDCGQDGEVRVSGAHRRRLHSGAWQAVEVEAEDEYALLYNWLEALLVKFEVNGMLYSKFKISRLEETSEGFRLKATVCGEKFNAEKHTQKVAVKAVTYHRMEIIQEANKVTLEFILDI